MRFAFDIAEKAVTVGLTVTAAMYVARGTHMVFEKARQHYGIK